MNQQKRNFSKCSVGKLCTMGVSILLTITLLLAFVPLNVSAVADNAISESTSSAQLQNQISASGKYTVQQVANELFGAVNIKICEYLYNLDDSADYIYVEFDDAGYAVFLKETMELLEYSAKGRLEYPEAASAKYYGGPGTYMVKENNYFVDTMSQKVLHVTEESAQKYAADVRGMLLSNSDERLKGKKVEFDYSALGSDTKKNADVAETRASVPSIDTEKPIILTNGTYIPNYQYFLHEPKHGTNSTGTCAAVAAQLLLSYHNYYSDHRIVADRFLNGGSNSYSEKQKNPNYCTDPMLMNSYTLGTRGDKEDGSDDPNSYFHYIVNRFPFEIAETEKEGGANGDESPTLTLSVEELRNGISSILATRNSEISGTINYTTALYSATASVGNYPSRVINELNAGRPVILLLREELGGTNHYVVAYGYNSYKYPGTSISYPGYIAHFGWQKKKDGTRYVNVWANAAWCSKVITLDIEHPHRYSYDDEIGSTGRSKYVCTDCGHRTDAAIVVAAETAYVERVANIPQNNYTYKDYYVTFERAGDMLFQTFGTKDARIYLFDTENNQLAFDDDSGQGYNALFDYTVAAGTPYILRVQFWNESDSGDVKLAITPADFEYDSYEEIEPMTGTGEVWDFDLYLNAPALLTFTPSASGTYRIKTTPYDDIDVVVYVVDATSTNTCHCDDNGSASQISNFTMSLTAGKSYFIAVSASDITTEEGFVEFRIQKVS